MAIIYCGGGYYVYFNYAADDSAAKELDDKLKSEGFTDYSIIQADLSNCRGVEQFVASVLETSKEIDVLVLNTSRTNRKSFWDMEYSEYIAVMDTNLNMPYYILKLFSKAICNDGSIVFTGSILGQIPHASCLPYGVSKAGIHFLVKCLTKEFSSRRITVNAVCPGFTETPWQSSKSSAQKERIEGKIALHRFGHPEEIASAVMHIISNRYMNGAIVNVDGGYDYH